MTITLFIDDTPHEVREGDNLLKAILSLGLDLPYFCWHPALNSVGACRQCAVKIFRDGDDKKGRITMACMTPVRDGQRISLKDPEAVAFRAAVIGWLMTNHPHDCPVCDEGGECHLQDMTVMTGHNSRQYRFTKRTFRNQDLGPLIHHEMNRCIQCYRCVRFYRDVAGGTDLDVFGSRNKSYFGRFEDGVLESPFSGNLVEICPTGVFTDKTLRRHYTRKWDLQSAPSICTLCALGCNTLPGERYGTLRRILNRYNPDVNGYFLCDRGRFGYEFVNSPRRIRQPRVRRSDGEGAEAVSPDEAIRRIAAMLEESKGVVGIGSPRASLESNYALWRLVGADRFFNGVAAEDARDVARALCIMAEDAGRVRSLDEVRAADAILVLGEDVTHTAPLLALAIRQAVHAPRPGSEADKVPQWNDAMKRLVMQDDRRPLFIAAPHPTALDHAATETYRAAPADVARLGFAVARAIDGDRPAVGGFSDETSALADRIAGALVAAENPLVVAGVAAGSETVRAAAAVTVALGAVGKRAGIFWAFPECNTSGVALLSRQDLFGAFDAVARGEADTVIVLENDLFRRAGERDVAAFLDSTARLVVVDFMENRLTERAHAVLPAATFAESNGTLVNAELRAQRYRQVFPAAAEIRAGWRWMADLLTATGRDDARGWTRCEDVAAAMARELPVFAPVAELAAAEALGMPGVKVPRQSPRYSGRTSMDARVDVREPKPPEDAASPLAFSMEGTHGMPPPALTPRYWSAGWNSVQALNKFQEEVGGRLRGPAPGRRLTVPDESALAVSSEIPEPFRPRAGQWLVVGIHHLFGSEPLSLETPALAELAPAPYLALNDGDIAALGAKEGDTMAVGLEDGATLRLRLRAVPGLVSGLAGLPAGLAGIPHLPRGAWVTIGRAS